MSDRVDNTLLREAFLRQGATASSVARECGWMKDDCGHDRQIPDITQLKRMLGIVPGVSRKRTRFGERDYVWYRRTVSYDDAVKIALAIGVDPYQVGV